MAPIADPFALVSEVWLLRYVDELTSIEPYSGWRTCGSKGERQAFKLVEHRLSRHSYLVDNGLEIELESFRTAVGVEFHRSDLVLDVGGANIEVPAQAIAGHAYNLELCALYDSDGDLGDLNRDPVIGEGSIVTLTDEADVYSLGEGELQSMIAVVDYALLDRVIVGSNEAFARANSIFTAGAAGIVAVTEDSLQVGESHGSFAGDSSIFNYLQADPPIPVLITLLEDLVEAGIDGWSELAEVDSARLVWDVDMVMPGSSNNLVARIPGSDPTQAVILSAHLDSPNSPGALDNGSGSAALLEIARVLDRARLTPPVDVYLVWFGCHEKGLFGSSHFIAARQDLLDRSLAVIELDAMARPLDGIDDPVNLESWSYSRLGNDRLPFLDFVQRKMGARGTDIETWDVHHLLSDVSGFVPYDVPNALLDNLDLAAMDQIGSAHYIAHWHTPYDVVEHAEVEADTFAELTRVLLAAALDTGSDRPPLRVTPQPIARAVFLANHTESVHMAPLLFPDLGMALSWEGLDVDLVPWGRPLAAEDLAGAAMVVVLPVHDHPSALSGVDAYDEAWGPAEIEVLTDYVDSGGLLVLTNSASRLGPFARMRESNEDWPDLNAVAAPFGISFTGPITESAAVAVPGHELTSGVAALTMIGGNALGLEVDDRPFEELAWTPSGLTVVAVDPGGDGEVVALADIGILVSPSGEPVNLRFWQNLARYARHRTTR